jgi:hypothetical protein
VSVPGDSAADPSVTLEVWTVRGRDVPATVIAGRRELRRLRCDPAVSFAKLLGTAGRSFQPWDATPARWALLTSAHSGVRRRPVAAKAVEHASLRLRPLWSRGSWDGHPVFSRAGRAARSWTGPVVVVTRSTLRPARAARFYRTIPDIAAALGEAPGLQVAFGIGEAPLLRQGTVSIWDSQRAMAAFARGCEAHVAAIRATPDVGWYAEELFAGLAVESADGSIDGVRL